VYCKQDTSPIPIYFNQRCELIMRPIIRVHCTLYYVTCYLCNSLYFKINKQINTFLTFRYEDRLLLDPSKPSILFCSRLVRDSKTRTGTQTWSWFDYNRTFISKLVVQSKFIHVFCVPRNAVNPYWRMGKKILFVPLISSVSKNAGFWCSHVAPGFRGIFVPLISRTSPTK